MIGIGIPISQSNRPLPIGVLRFSTRYHDPDGARSIRISAAAATTSVTSGCLDEVDHQKTCDTNKSSMEQVVNTSRRHRKEVGKSLYLRNPESSPTRFGLRSRRRRETSRCARCHRLWMGPHTSARWTAAEVVGRKPGIRSQCDREPDRAPGCSFARMVACPNGSHRQRSSHNGCTLPL